MYAREKEKIKNWRRKLLLGKLKNHVSQNLIHFQNVSRETLTLLANLKGREYLCFDTESCKVFYDNTKERVWAWALSNTINDTVIYGYTLYEFIEFFKNLYNYKVFNFDKKSKTKNLNIKMWVHNLGWDFEFFKYFLDENDFTYYSKILYDDNTVEEEVLDCDSFNITENNGQVYNSTLNIKMNDLIFGKKKFKSFIKIKMYDSGKLIPDKLEKIGKKIIKIDEMFYKLGDEFDYEMIRPYNYVLSEIDKCYVYNDVYILKEFIRQYYIDNNLEGYTASGIAFNNMLNFKYPDAQKKYEEFTKDYPEMKDKKIIDIIDNSYTGGFTYCNPSYKGKIVQKEGHSIDRNSSYPAAMMYNKLPYGMPKYFEGKYEFDEKYDIAFQKVHFDGFRRKNNSNIGFLKIGSCCDFLADIKEYGFKKNDYASTNFDKDGQLLTCNYNLVFTIDELELLMSVYDFYTYKRVGDKILKGSRNLVKNIEYVEGIKFLSRIGDFADFINDCVIRKNKYKEEKNECGKEVAKRDMNSVYGKLGSGFTRTIMQYIKDDNGFFKMQRKYINDCEFDYEEKRKYYRPVASFTTSYGRIALFSIIIQIENVYGSENFLYSDTDSIYSTLKVKQLKSLGIDLHGTRLGAWDIEKEFYKFKCLGAKKYILYGHEYTSKSKNYYIKKAKEKKPEFKNEIIKHCAGLPKEVQETLNFENFYLGRKFMRKKKKKVIGGYRLEMEEFTLKDFTFY